MKAKEGTLHIGSLVITIQAFMLTQSQLIGCIANLGMATPILLFFQKLKVFLKDEQHCDAAESSKPFIQSFEEIRFENVSFAYPDGRVALTNINFSIKRGEKIALVGENGAGKSTLVKLLLRFYEPTQGTITVDGKDLASFDLKSWRSAISCVFQDFGQYHLTVHENIALGDLNAQPEAISKAAQKSGFETTQEKLPLGANTPLGKEFGGTSLSGGEWQKLAMSRAFVRESASLLILDEPSSSLDPQSEQAIFKLFAEQSQGKTALLITHRLGSVKMTDRILVLKKGRLAEEGTHHHLLNLNQEYASLFLLQANQYRLTESVL